MGILTAGRHVDFVERHLPERVKAPLKQVVKSYRCLTKNLRSRPDFIIIGARKCGTTSLYSYLVQHPSILPALKKEIFYFSHYYNKGEAWYRSHFPTTIERWMVEKLRRQDVVTGEATPCYIFDPELPCLIRKMNPQVRLIATLRNPVDALYSAYEFGIKTGTYTREEVVFDTMVEAEIQAMKGLTRNQKQSNLYMEVADSFPVLSRGLYADMLESWYEEFPQDRIHVIISRFLFHDTQATMDGVLKFLGLPSYTLPKYEKRNANSYSPIKPRTREMLEEFFAPHNRKLESRLGIKTGWSV